MAAHRQLNRDRLAQLAAADPGWHAYALSEAEELVRDDPMVNGGLVAEVETQIGPEATKAARRALEWFNKQRGRN